VDPPWIDVGGFRIQAPVTVATNLLLAVQCARYWALLRKEPGRVSRLWALFFLGMAVATLAGAPKHGLRHVLGAAQLSLLLWVSAVGAGLAVFCAQGATILAHAGPARRAGLRHTCWAQLVLNGGASVTLGPRVGVVIANTAVGLSPVIIAHAWGRAEVLGAMPESPAASCSLC